MWRDIEQEVWHSSSGRLVRDIVLGVSDGLTVPFALAAGLSGAVDTGWIVVLAGIAEVAAGSLAMGLGGYLSAKSEREFYDKELAREHREIHELTQHEVEEVRTVFRGYGMEGESLEQATAAVIRHPKTWVEFMMREELGLHPPPAGSLARTAWAIGLSYAAGGLVPLFPYFFPIPIRRALGISAVITLASLFVFGFVKAKFTGALKLKSGIETMLIGALAGTAAYLLVAFIAH